MNLLRAELKAAGCAEAVASAGCVEAVASAWRPAAAYAIAAVAAGAVGSERRVGDLRLTAAATPRSGRFYGAELAAGAGSGGLVISVVLARRRPGAVVLWLLNAVAAGLAAVACGFAFWGRDG
jgi:hypothetical protein